MAYNIVWPVTLPQAPQRGYTETGGVLVVRTPTDSGPAKLRKRGSKPQTMNVQFIMNSTQVATLENFVKTITQGTIRFGFPHPRLGVVSEVRIVPQGEGEYYTISYAAPDFYTVQLTLEILP